MTERLLQSLEDPSGSERYAKYQDDPVGFIEQVLGERLTEDTKRLAESVRDNTITLAKSANATGKALPVDEIVITPSGPVEIGSLSVGDYVIDADGKPTMVVGVFPQGILPVYRVVFNDGASILASGDHLWTVRSSSGKYRKGPWRNITTEELSGKIHLHMHIPMCGPVEYKAKRLGIHPYLMGALLGDGCLTENARLSNPEKFIIEKIRDLVSAHAGGPRLVSYSHKEHAIVTDRGRPNPILDELKACGLIGKKSVEKFIPRDYLLASVGARKALLAGIMDTDGHISKKHSMGVDISSRVLAKDIRELVLSLGGTAKITSRTPSYTYNGERREGARSYRIRIKLPFCPFTLPRHVARYVDERELQKQSQRIVKKITPAGCAECVCIKVEADNGLFLARDFIVTHNTHIAARLAVWFFRCFDEVQVYTAAAPPSDNLRRLLWGEIGDVLRRHDEMFRGHDRKALEVRRGPLDFLVGVTIPATGDPAERVAKFSGKHRPHLMFIIDEGDAVPEEVYEGIETCMSGGIIVRLLVMFNPRAERGRVYRMERDGTAAVVHLSAFKHPNVISGRNEIPGAVTREITVARINKYCRRLVDGEQPDRSCFKLPDFLVGATAKRDDGSEWPPLVAGTYKPTASIFSYMVLGRYPAQASDQLISREWVDAAVARWQQWVSTHGERPPEKVYAIQGVDVADMGGDLNVTFFRWGSWVEPAITWSGVDVDEGALRCIREYRKRNVLRCCVDATGVGAGVAPHMVRKGCSAFAVRVANSPTEISDMGEFRRLRDQLLWAYREWLRTDPAAMLPPDEMLIEESLAATYTTDTGKIEVSSTDELKEHLKRSPDRLMAIAQTFYKPAPLFKKWEQKTRR